LSCEGNGIGMTTSSSTNLRRRSSSRRWIVFVAVAVIAIVAAVLILRGPSSRAATDLPATTKVARGALTATVAGSGSVAAEQTVNLPFASAGTVTEVLVKDGDAVKAGQVLAKLDDRAAQLQVESAQGSLESAMARLQQAQQGNARSEDLDAVNAQLAAAQANYDKASKGGTAADRTAAQAAVKSAQAAYDAAVRAAGSSGSQLEAARAALVKTENMLNQAQANYDRVGSAPDIGRRPEALALQNATVDQAQAQANYDALANTSNTDAQARIASAAAQLAQARASLNKLTPSTDDLAAAKANLDQAKATVAKLTAPATTLDQQIAQAAVSQAQAALKQAELALDNTLLKAPFDGIVAQVNVVAGNAANSATPALRLINRNPLHVDLRLSENDVAQVQKDQDVTLTIQSLGDWSTKGKVSYIAPAADNNNGLVTYPVRVSFADNDPRVKVGMTADLKIVTALKENALLVPNTALLPKGSGRVVQVLTKDEKGQASTQEVEVHTGLTDGTVTEITGGVQEGQEILTLPSNGASRSNGGRGFFGG
jgi:HlyD family secretion protein